jgi:hypothetical protein
MLTSIVLACTIPVEDRLDLVTSQTLGRLVSDVRRLFIFREREVVPPFRCLRDAPQDNCTVCFSVLLLQKR